MVWNNLLHFILGGTLDEERRDTRRHYAKVKVLADGAPYRKEDLEDVVCAIVAEACTRADVVPIGPLSEALAQAVEGCLVGDGLIFGFPTIDVASLSGTGGVELRTYLKRKETFLKDHERRFEACREKLIAIVMGLLEYLPSTAFKEEWGGPDPASTSTETVALGELLDKPAELIERLLVTFWDSDVLELELFEPLRTQLEQRIFVASDIPWDERHSTRRKFVYPTQQRPLPVLQLAHLYLDGTPWLAFLEAALPFSVPFPARFEHTHIMGGSGHGKTQLLQLQILRDLQQSQIDGRSVVVMDSQGDLIRTISHLKLFEPGSLGSLADRLMLIDPTDVEYPVALNMFDADRAGMEAMSLLDRERILNATVDLYEYFFGALLGAELTARQGIIFKYLARLLLEIPDATIHTFRQLMENGERFRPYMQRLPPTSRAFFEERFFDRSFGETKKQVLTRLWGVLSNPTFDRMFSHPRSKVDLFAALQEGRIVLINTAKDLLKEEGASILGRFFIALLAQAALRRAALPAHERRPCFVYVDEAADYFDDKIGHLLNQARKYKVGMVLAHQNLDQLAPALRASVFSSTSIKYAGGISGKDAAHLTSEMHVGADLLLAQRKHRTTTSFACYVRNVTPQALSLSIPLGEVERMPMMNEDAFAALRDASRAAYCIPLSEVPSAREEVAPPPRSRTQRPTTPPPASPADEAHKVDPIEVILSSSLNRPLPPEATVEGTGPAKPPAPTRRPSAPKAARTPPPLGGGGREHKYLANLIKEFAQSKGFLAVIEEVILDGTGRVDVSLSKGGLRLACEISVTNGRDYELGNIEKCLAAGFAHVLFITSDEKHRKAMEKLARRQLEEADAAKVHFCAPESALSLIASLGGPSVSEAVVRGYKVKTRQTVLDPEEAERRRGAVAAVIAKSLAGKHGESR